MRCKSKAQEGQYSRAVQALVSCGLAEYSPQSLFEMQLELGRQVAENEFKSKYSSFEIALLIF